MQVHGRTLLQIASEKGLTDIVEMLSDSSCEREGSPVNHLATQNFCPAKV